MKFALVVLGCLVAASSQQNPLWSMPQYHQQTPLQYHDPYPGTHNLRQWENFYPGSYPYYPTQFSQSRLTKYLPFLAKQNLNVILMKPSQTPDHDEELIENRESPIYFNEGGFIEAKVASPKSVAQEGRLLLNTALLSNLLFGTVATITKFAIATTTIASVSIISCLPAASFVDGSTNACRRRRDVSVMQELINDHGVLSPSAVESVEPSATLKLESLTDVDAAKAAQNSVTIVSSLENGNNNRATGARFIGLNALLSVTVTSTLTTAVISVTNSRKTVTLGESLSCLPMGIQLC